MSPDVTLSQLRYFVETAERLSMTAAAAQLCVAQSAVSSAISQLERQLRVQLFVRDRATGLQLTTAGHVLRQHATEVLRRLDETVDEVQATQNRVAGHIDLACMVTVAPFLVPSLLSNLETQHPGLDVTVHELESGHIPSDLLSGHCELAVLYDLGHLDARISATQLRTIPLSVLLPPDHSLACEAEVDPTLLAEESMILLDLPLSNQYFLSAMRAHGVEPRVGYRSTNYETVRALVAHGRGYALLNQQPVEPVTYDGGTVVVRPLKEPTQALDLVIAVRAGEPLSARARAVAQRLQALFGDRGKDDGGRL